MDYKNVQPFGLSWEDIELTIKARKLIFQRQAWVGNTMWEVDLRQIEREHFLEDLRQSPGLEGM